MTPRLHPEARHHARRAINYLVEAYDLDDAVALNDGYLAIGPTTSVTVLLTTPDNVGARIRQEEGHFHLEARHEGGPWLPVLHRLPQAQLERIFLTVSAIDQDKHMGGPRPPKEGDT